MTAETYRLEPLASQGQKSFYGKAVVESDGDEKTLRSYGTAVCRIRGGEVSYGPKAACSMTTMKHVKAFVFRETGAKVTTEEIRKAVSEWS